MLTDRRTQLIRELVRDRIVLDIGCVGHSAHQADTPNWLHEVIRNEAKEVVGLDYMASEVAKLRERGYDIVLGDAHTVDLGREFDCVVAGELTEHLENPGMFLTNMLKHLKPGGTLVLSTPNPFYPKRFMEILVLGKPPVTPEHVSWFCAQTLEQLLTRMGYDRIKIEFINFSEAFLGIGRLPSLLRPWLCTNLLARAQKPVIADRDP